MVRARSIELGLSSVRATLLEFIVEGSCLSRETAGMLLDDYVRAVCARRRKKPKEEQNG